MNSKSWDEEIALLSAVVPGKDEDGFPIEGVPIQTLILANRLPVTSSEYYQSNNQGYLISEAFEIHTMEYNGEQSLLFDGVEYRIRRTYRKVELTELYCERSDVTHG